MDVGFILWMKIKRMNASWVWGIGASSQYRHREFLDCKPVDWSDAMQIPFKVLLDDLVICFFCESNRNFRQYNHLCSEIASVSCRPAWIQFSSSVEQLVRNLPISWLNRFSESRRGFLRFFGFSISGCVNEAGLRRFLAFKWSAGLSIFMSWCSSALFLQGWAVPRNFQDLWWCVVLVSVSGSCMSFLPKLIWS